MSDNLGCSRWILIVLMLALGLWTFVSCDANGIIVREVATGEEFALDGTFLQIGVFPFDSLRSDTIVAEEVDLPQAPRGDSDSSPLGQPIINQTVGEPMNCTGLRPTSPTDGFAYAPTTFYWDPAPSLPTAEVTYTVVVYDFTSGVVVTSASTSGDQTSLSIEMGSQLMAFSNMFVGALSWDIVATRADGLSCAASANGGAPIGVDIRNSPFEPGKGGGGSDDDSPPSDDEYEPPSDPPYDPPYDPPGEG